MQDNLTTQDFKSPSRTFRATALVALAAAVALLLTTLWPADGLATQAAPGSSQLLSLSDAVVHAAAKNKTGKKKKQKKQQQKAKLCNKFKTVKVKGKKKRVKVFKTVTVRTRVKRGGRFVTVKVKRRVPVKVKCNKSSGGPQNLGVPVTITLDTGSYATLDFYQFTKQTPVHGTVSGYIPGSYVQGQANTVNLTRGHISVDQVPVFVDDVCNGQVSAAIRTGKQTYADIDKSKSSTTTISPAGSLQGSLSLQLHVNIELRHGDLGCNQPYLTTGYTTLPVTFRVFGKLNGFTTTLDTPDTILDNLGVCVWPGADTLPCGGYQIPLPIGLATHVVGSVAIG